MAASSPVASLHASLVVNSDPLNRGLTAAGARVERFGKNSNRQFDRFDRKARGAFGSVGLAAKNLAMNLGKSGLAAGLAALGGRVIVDRISDTARAIAEIGDQAQQAGLDVIAFQELAAVARQNRIEVQDLSSAMRELLLRGSEFVDLGSGSGADAFRQLGFGADELREKLNNPNELLFEIIGKMESLDNATRIRLADELFGGDAERVIRLLDQGEGSIRRMVEQAHQAGRIFDSELVTRADELNQAITVAGESIGGNLQAAIVNASWALFDFLQQWQAFESRTDLSLTKSLSDLGRERVEVENEILRLQSEQRRNQEATEPVTDAAMLTNQVNASAIQRERERFEQIAEEERQILAVLESRTPITPPEFEPGSGGGGGGGATTLDRTEAITETERQAEATDKLIRELREELQLVGQSAVEKRVMNELRRAGVTLASAEGQTIASLVREIEAEETALRQVEDAMQNMGSMAQDVLGGIVSDLRAGESAADSLNNAVGRLRDRLMDMALDGAIQALVSGLTVAFSGGFGGTLPSQPINLLAASGGMVSGPGTGTSDSIPARLSNGEYVVNARATSKNKAILDAINSGARNFANGGFVGSRQMVDATVSSAGRMGELTVRNKLEIDVTGGEVQDRQSRTESGVNVERIVIGTVARGIAQGRLDGAMKSSFGVKRQGRA